MSMTKLGLTPGPLVCTLFAIFLFVLKSPLLVFWGITPGLLVRTIFEIFFYVLKNLFLVFLYLTFLNQKESIPLLMFFRLMVSHQKESSLKVVASFQYFCSQIEYFPSKFQNQFIVFFPIV